MQKADLNNATGVETSSFAKKAYLANLTSDVDKLNIDRLKNVPNNSKNLKSKEHNLDVDELIPVLIN